MRLGINDRDPRLESEARAFPDVFAAISLESVDRAVRVLAATVLLAEVPQFQFARILLEKSKDSRVLILALGCLPPAEYEPIRAKIESLVLENLSDETLFASAMRILLVVDLNRATEIVLDLLENGTSNEIRARAASFLRSANRPDFVSRLVNIWAAGIRSKNGEPISGEDPLLKAFTLLEPGTLDLISKEVLRLQLDPTATNLFIYGMRDAEPGFASAFFSEILRGDYPTIHKRQAIFALAQVKDRDVIAHFVDLLISTTSDNPLRADFLAGAAFLNPALLDARSLLDLRGKSEDFTVKACLSLLIAKSDLTGVDADSLARIRQDLESQVMSESSSQSIVAAEALTGVAQREIGGAARIAACLNRLPSDKPAFERLVRGASRGELDLELLTVMRRIGASPETKPSMRLDAVRYVFRVGDPDSQTAILSIAVSLLRDRQFGLQTAIMAGESCRPEMLAKLRDALLASGDSVASQRQVLSLLEDFLEEHQNSQEGGK